MLTYCYVESDGTLEELDPDFVAFEMPEVAQSAKGTVDFQGRELPCFLWRGGSVILGWSTGDGSLTPTTGLPPAPQLSTPSSDNKKATKTHGRLVHVDEYRSWIQEKDEFLKEYHAVTG